MVRAAKAAMRLNLSQSSSHAPESPEMSMSEGEPLLGAYSRATSPSTYTPPPLRRPGAFSTPSSPSPLGVRHFSSGHSVPNSPVPPPSPAFSSGGFFDTPTAPVAAVARGRRFRFAALAGVGVIAIIGFASLGAADPDRLQRHVVDPMKDALHAAGEAASQGYDQVKGWTGWQAPPDSPDEDWSKDITVTPVEGDRPIVDEDVPAQEAPKVEVIAETDEAQKEATPTDADAALLATPSEAIEPSSISSEEPIPIAIPTSFHSVDPVPQQEAPIEDESAVVPLYVLPDPPRLPRGGPDEKFFAYLPHSGFHNQRIELANAMTLAWMLNRTLLVPPVWIGWPITTLPYRPLQDTWDKQMRLHPEAFTPRDDSTTTAVLAKRQAKPKKGKGKPKAAKPVKPTPSAKKVLTEDECKSYAKECKSTYQDTFVAWSFLADIELAAMRVPLVDRFNMSEAFMAELTGAAPEQTRVLNDSAKYWYQFFDTDKNNEKMIEPMDFEKTKYHHRVSITKLAAGTKDYKLVTMGSIFGSTRLILDKKVNSRMLNNFHRSLAFRNRILDEPANRIRDLLGGPGRYVGVHARVGDGQFMRHAKENMQRTFQELVVDKLGVDKALLPTLLAAGERRAASYPPPASKDRRTLVESPWSGFDSPVEEGIPSLVEEPARLTRRQAARLAVADRETSPLSSTLSCRGELYNDPALFALNAPLYVATDSSHPLSDPALSLFFANFPCSFILSDFDRKSEVNSGEPVRSLKTMERAVNVNDGVKLGRLLLPFMEAAVAAKSGAISGTNGSTFSAFAAGHLHQAYADDVSMGDE